MKKAVLLLPVICLFLLGLISADLSHATPQAEAVSADVAEMIQSEGSARVIVKLKMARPWSKESALSHAEAQRQRAEIARLQQEAGTRVLGTGSRLRRTFKSLPYIAMNLDQAGLTNLLADDSVVEIVYIDRLLQPSLIESTYQVEADIAHSIGITGDGSTIVVIDTGAEKSHPFLAGKVVHEACFATRDDGVTGACPNRKTSQVGRDAGEPCTFDSLSCYHGTHVSGIAVGSNSTMSGVAPGATLIPIQVFHQSGFCSPFTACANALTSDVAAALEYVYDIRNRYPIAAVNMSLGGGIYSTDCDAEYPLMADAIANLKAVGIATVAAAGNDGNPAGITAPGCISSAVSVGAVDEFDNVAYFSNGAAQVDLLAPGTAIQSSVPGGGYSITDGTSMATPHVAGAWAIMRQAFGARDVDTEVGFLKSTGQPVTDARSGELVTLPRLRLAPAAGIENPVPVITAVSPDPVTAWKPDTVISITGTGFVRSTVVRADGVVLASTFLSDTQLEAVLPWDMLQTTAESITIELESPPVGGGTSNPVVLTLGQPEIAVSSTTVAAGEIVTATLSHGPGSLYDWMAIAEVGSPNTSYVRNTYVPSGESSMVWEVAMPTTPGLYEIRLFKNAGYTLLATSETITVGDVGDPSDPNPASPSISLSSTTPATGDTVTVTLTDGPGNANDWLAIAATGSPNTTYLQYTYVPAGETGMVWEVTMPSTPGEYEIRLFENGSYSRIATSATITVGDTGDPSDPNPASPSIALSSTTATAGATVSVTLTDGPGNLNDWLAVAVVGSPNTSYVQYVYVPAGETGMIWDVTMPLTPGEYEIRLFENGGYTRLATSATITVEAAGGGDPSDPNPASPSITLSATTAAAGETLTVTLTDGPGNLYDWLAIAAVGSPNTSYVQYTYVPAGETGMVWDVTMPTTPGEYEIRLFENAGYTRLATSDTITVSEAGGPSDPNPASPSIGVASTAATTGETVTVTLTDGPGNLYDWLAIAAVGSPNTSYLQYVYVPAGETGMVWDVTMPTTPGEYEIRLFENGTYTRLATSETITVSAADEPSDPDPVSPSITVSSTTATTGQTVTVTLTDGPGNPNDWLAIAAVGSPNRKYVRYTYVPPGETGMVWDVVMPTKAGEYEIRLFENGGYTRIATSETITVSK